MDKEELALFIGNKIKELRLLKNMTQSDLAELLRTTKQTIGRYENGSRRANQDTLFELADIFGKNIDDFFPKEDVSENITSTKKILDNVFGKLEEKRKLKVVDFAKFELRAQNQRKIIDLPGYSYDFYDNALSAGTGQFIGSTQIEQVMLPVDIEADYVVPVRGDSMEPDYHDGDYVFIQSTVNIDDGEIGVFDLYGDGYIKQLVLDGDKGYLHSLNPDYKDITIDEEVGNDFKVLGRVVDRYSEK